MATPPPQLPPLRVGHQTSAAITTASIINTSNNYNPTATATSSTRMYSERGGLCLLDGVEGEVVKGAASLCIW